MTEVLVNQSLRVMHELNSMCMLITPNTNFCFAANVWHEQTYSSLLSAASRQKKLCNTDYVHFKVKDIFDSYNKHS